MNYEARIEALIKCVPLNIKLYKTAFVHKSVKGVPSNERLEFVGDAVVGLLVAEYLYNLYPDADEGKLTKMRINIVSTKGLNHLATKLNLDEFIIMNNKGMKNEWNKNPKIMENAFEAFMGALYIDIGIDQTRRVLTNLIEEVMDDEYITHDGNYKDILSKTNKSIEYIYQEAGTGHTKCFIVKASIDGLVISEGFGTTKKDAEQSVARRVLMCMQLM